MSPNLFNDENIKSSTELIKDRTNNNINREALEATSNELAESNDTTPEIVQYELLKKYSTPDENGQVLFSRQQSKASLENEVSLEKADKSIVKHMRK